MNHIILRSILTSKETENTVRTSATVLVWCELRKSKQSLFVYWFRLYEFTCLQASFCQSCCSVLYTERCDSWNVWWSL